ncbi:Cilia- and flagella-associated protein 54 [Triplophysa tibetana]|uniref:Cilia-and flagella-associated protein 54 n=1 Tax=Triplophysa tibetana TaxID=1572043 RepID=A0A5A9PIN7_9TELE|nr:Cilia- and flagella-associated protein 54 [Triplophysa tibetana]
MEPAPASYYGPLDKNNPVLSTFQSDLKEIKAYIKKLLGSPNVDHRSYSRGSIKLFETWNKYKSRLPTLYFEEHLLKIADFLFANKLYRLALWQGYKIYLQQFSTISLESIKDVEDFKQTYFSDGLDAKRAPLTLRALQGECQCIFYLEREKGELPDSSGVQRMLSILGFLQILMQAVLPYESLCWILYNGSLRIYNICRFLMSVGHTTEVFARRALGKLSELIDLEEITGSPVPSETKQAYKEASIKGPWPRTPTERMLMEMFDGNAAQFLALLQALHDSSVRPLQTGMPEEFEVQEVVLELISAGITLLCVTSSSTLNEMAVAGDSKISVDAAVKFVKQLFRYEQWSMFGSLSAALMSTLHSVEGRPYRKYEQELTLLQAVECLISSQRVKFVMKDAGQADKERNTGSATMTEQFFNVIQTLHACVCIADKDIQPDADLVLDIVLFFWAKCKMVFQRAQMRHDDPVRYLEKMDNQEQWVKTLCLLCEVAHEHQLAEIDFISVAEMTLRLAMVLESLADAPPWSGRKTDKDGSEESILIGKPESTLYMGSRVEQLQTALDFAKRGVEYVSRCRARLSSEGFAVFDEMFMQKFQIQRDPQDSSTPDLTVLAMDLHLELLVFQHRLSLKLCDTCPDTSLMEIETPETNRLTEESVIVENIKKNKISKCVFLTQKALVTFRQDQTDKETKKILEEAITLIERAELEERKLVSTSSPPESCLGAVEKKQPPPAPILLSRSHLSMTFTPAPYALEEEVCWYCIYGKEAEGVNLKVRFKDCHLRGTGEMIPARSNRLLQVSCLEANQKYIFAVAAFDAQGRMLGSAIGETTRPLLASLPLPLLTTWAHLAQVSYQTGLHTLAKRACKELWSHFTFPASLDPEGPNPEQGACLERLAQTRLRPATVQMSSPILHQLFLSTIFIQTDIQIQEGALYSDHLSDGGPLIWGQEARLAECERMLVAIDFSLHINDSSNTLQAVVNCYGLLCPIIYHQIPSELVIEVLLKCFTVLLEIPELLKQKRPATTAESLQHMVACMTYYLAKSLNFIQETRMASSVIESGKKLLQEITEPSLAPHKKTPSAQKKIEEPNEHIKALNGIFVKTMQAEDYDVSSSNKTASHGHVLTGLEDPVVVYKEIQNKPLQNAFQEVIKFKQRSCFLEFVLCLLQKALQEEELDLVIQWEQHILEWLSRRDEALLALKDHQNQAGEEFKEFTTSVIEYNTKKQGNLYLGGKKLRRKKLLSAFECQNSEREIKAVDILLNQLAAFIRRHQHAGKLRKIRSEDSLRRCHINLSLASAYLSLLRRNLGPPPQLCFSHLPLSFFSLAHCGTMVMWKNVPHYIWSPELRLPKADSHPECVRHKVNNTKYGASNASDEESETESEMHSKVKCAHNPEINELHSVNGPPEGQTTFQLLETLNKASINIRRAMVLAHRWGQWTTLQWACRILWDQSSTLVLMVERLQSPDVHNRQLTMEQLYTVITPLLVLATDLLMDMMEKLKLWNVYDTEEEELEASLYFSAPMDDGTVVDLRWLRTLVLHTLELLYYQAKWENLSHLALLYNTYTRERYSHIVTPLLVHAQRRLLDRISYFGGPPDPQPHFTHTETINGQKVTCRTYAGEQLLFPRGKGRLIKNDFLTESQELADVRTAMCLVCVPLDVDDALNCFRETLERRRHSLLTFQHSRTLLHLLLADTQHPYVEVPFSKEPSGVLQGKVEFNLAASTPPGVSPLDLSDEDFSTLGSIYSTTLPPSKIQTILSSYNNAISENQLELVRLGTCSLLEFVHESAHSFWCKALDCALQSSGVLDSWDGDSWDSKTSLETLRHAGIWGCLQGALLSAKIAQHILTSNINQRTKCCLLSTKLFKCLLMASMPHPMTDLSYSRYSVETELIPGIDLFSEPDRGNLGTSVASLSFLCHWLYNSGHFLKIKVLTELRMFSQAVEELNSLTFGEEIPPHHGGNHRGIAEPSRTTKRFIEEEPLLDPSNLQVLEGVVNKSPSGDIMALYGSKLTKRLLMTRVHLILAICSTIQNLPEPPTPDPSKITETEEKSSEICLSDVPSGVAVDCNTPPNNIQKPRGLQFNAQKDKFTLGKLKALLLKEAHALVSPEIFASQQLKTDPEELELEVDVRLLMSSINQQQGRMADSADLAVSSMNLLQRSPVFQSDFRPLPPPRTPSSSLRRSRSKVHQISSQEPKSIPGLQTGDVPAWVEARERMDRLFWLRCRLAVVCSLVGHIPGTSIYAGVDSSAEAFRVLKEGLEEADAWGDPDTKALLLLQGVQMNTHCGKAREDSTSMLQEIVSLLSGRIALSQRSQMALAEAALLLSDLRGTGGQTLHRLTQKLLQQQLSAFGESLNLKKAGEVEFQSECPKNIYLLQIPLLAKTTMRMGHSLGWQALSGCSEGGEEPWMLLVSAQDVLQSALNISQASAHRDLQMEADILYCTGWLGSRRLISMQKNDPKKILKAFLQCVLFHHSHSHNLLLIHRCYLEMALVCLQQWEQIAPPPVHLARSPSSAPEETTKETVGEKYLLLFWVCLRIALKTSEAIGRCHRFHGFNEDAEGHLSPSTIKALPGFALNDLLHPCGGLENHGNLILSSEAFVDTKHELTWMQMSRYYTHLLKLLRVSSRPGAMKCADGLTSVAGYCNLALRLSQLHSFFCCHLPSYREQWSVPDPPVTLILDPQLIQILLIFAVNNDAMSPSAEVMAGLQAGQSLVCLDRLKAVHALLGSLCAEMDGNVSPTASSSSSISPQEGQSRTSTSMPSRQEMLLEKTARVCTEIRDLLKPDFNSTPITELPFDPSMQTLHDLEHCFNPLIGSTLRDTGFITWFLSLLS